MVLVLRLSVAGVVMDLNITEGGYDADNDDVVAVRKSLARSGAGIERVERSAREIEALKRRLSRRRKTREERESGLASSCSPEPRQSRDNGRRTAATFLAGNGSGKGLPRSMRGRRSTAIGPQPRELVNESDFALPVIPLRRVTSVSVSEPVRIGSGFASYIVYTVEARSEETTARVRRRYREFAWLDELLRQFYPKSAFKPLPEKKFFGRFDADFVQMRRAGLEAFMNSVVRDRDARRSEVLLHIFLNDAIVDCSSISKDQSARVAASASGAGTGLNRSSSASRRQARRAYHGI